MKCPKCGNEQEESSQCQACGIYFAKYWQTQKRMVYGEPVSEKEEEPSNKRGLIYGIIVFAIVISYFMFSNGSKPPQEIATDTSTVKRVAEAQKTPTITNTINANGKSGGSPIENARNATVLIRTDWGAGSGFFVSAKCDIITNRHVLQIDKKLIKAATKELYEAETVLDEYKERIDTARDAFIKTCSDCSEEAFEQKIGQYQKKHEVAERRLVEKQDRLYNIQQDANVEVTLADGTEFTAFITVIRDDIDIARLGISKEACPYIETGNENNLKHGEKLYTVGNPMGLKHSVSSGVFSGFREGKLHQYIQTDAPINPGNSGGPLIDAKGKVVGINTLTITNADGIGFAIPISVAVRELGLTP